MLQTCFAMSHIVRYAIGNAVWCGSAPKRGIVAAWVALLYCAAPAAHADTIFKCVDASARITYQSSACRDGAPIDIAPGAYDAAAAARLREDADAWNRRDDLRRALAARVAAEEVRGYDGDSPARTGAAGRDAEAPGCAYCDNVGMPVAWPYPPWSIAPHRPSRPHPHPRAPPVPYRILVR
jgi:hypothetical protein